MSIEGIIQDKLNDLGIKCTMLAQGHVPKIEINGKEYYGAEHQVVVRDFDPKAEDSVVADALLEKILKLRKRGERLATIRKVATQQQGDDTSKVLAYVSVSFIYA